MLRRALAERWHGDGGYRELLKVAFPLIISTGMWSLQRVIDRAFLSWYANEAVAASMNAGITSFVIIALFTGTASYANTFVAQYRGAGRPQRVGLAIWQAIFFSLAAGALLLIVSQVASGFFGLVGHAPELAKPERAYFRIIMGGSVFLVLGTALSAFFSGREDTVTVMFVTIVSVVVNVALDYLWIFGHLGFPQMGVVGAAWATIVSYAVYALAFFLLMLRRKFRMEFGVLSGCRFDRDLFRRLLRFGLPTGVSFSLEIAVWALFVILIGKYGVTQSAATAVTFNINMLAFMPIFGTAIAVSTLVGRYQGAESPRLSARTTWSAVHLTTAYTVLYNVLILVVPGAFTFVFSLRADPVEFQPVAALTFVLLRFVALYTVFDGVAIVLHGTLKGAGDTRYPMVVTTALAWGVIAAPSLVVYWLGRGSLHVHWWLATAYVILLSAAFLLRFLEGKWRAMRVIEEEVVPHVAPQPDVPPAEAE